MTHLPTVKSFLIADQVFRQDSGKWCVIGIFDKITVRRFPTLYPSIGVFFRCSDGEGTFDVLIELQDSTGRVLGKIEGISITIKDRAATVDFGITTYSLPIPAPGTYFVKLYFNGTLCDAADNKLTAVELGESQ